MRQLIKNTIVNDVADVIEARDEKRKLAVVYATDRTLRIKPTNKA